eukprot:3905163-Alexandrium_andersonii.AAC.1
MLVSLCFGRRLLLTRPPGSARQRHLERAGGAAWRGGSTLVKQGRGPKSGGPPWACVRRRSDL